MIDAHHHLWQPARGDYDWMKPDSPLSRPFTPADLAPIVARHDITKTVLVQAAPTVAETDYMLGLADATPFVGGVVGWIDFENPDHARHLARWAAHPKFCGVRPMIQNIPDVDWMLRDDVQWAFAALIEHDLTFDALGFPRHLGNFARIAEKYPDLRFVIDHAMKPAIGGDGDKDWFDGMSRLADLGVWCKFSGLVTEAAADWRTDDLRPYADHLFSRFTPERVMWGSDWPVCTLAAPYDGWVSAAQELCAGQGQAARDRIFAGSAAEFYRLAP